MTRRRTAARGLMWGTGVLAATLVAIGGVPVQATPVERPPAPRQEEPFDPQAGEPDAPFAGYRGLIDGTGGGAATPDEDDPSTKTEDLGPVGKRPTNPQDVPGTGGATEAPVDDGTTELVHPTDADGDSAATLAAAVESGQSGTAGKARVIVTMNVAVQAEAELSAAAVDDQRGAIDESLATLGGLLDGTESAVLTEFEVVPAAVVEVDQAGLDALLADPSVAAVTLDQEFPAALDVSTGVIDSDLLNSAGVLGNNWEGSAGGAFEVAILDSGVDDDHDAFSGRIVAQACFSNTSWCPNGLTTQTGAGAADNCTYSTQCDHGTHVGGIAAGASYTGGHEGVARGARIVAVQIGHRSVSCGGGTNPCWRYFFSDLDLALQHVLNLRNGGRNIASLNMSLGGPLYTSQATCDAGHPNTQNLAANLQAAGVAVVAAAGNDGFSDRNSYPGCLTSSFAVSASDDADVPAGFTNSDDTTNWWAPGVNIDAPVTTSATATGPKSGTSMASPHVAGAFALLRECVDGNGVPQTTAAAASDLDATGVDITRGGITRRRINVLDAATRNVNNNDFASPETLPANPGAGFNDFDFNICADAEAGEPGPGSLDNSVWWTWTPSATGTATISTEDGGGNVTTFDTTLTVYTGSTLATLTNVGFDDDGGTGTRSLVVMPVQGGTTYRIKVDGFAASNGLLNLHLENGPPPTCQGIAATRVGTIAADVINGTAGADVIVAGDGSDEINSGDGNDRICGGAGDDTIHAADGEDFVSGGPDADRIYGEGDDDTLLGNAGGGDNDDTGDIINGGFGDDVLDGWVGDDTLQGGPDDDSIVGEDGNDTATFSGSGNEINASLTSNTANGAGSDGLSGIENLSGSPQDDTLTGSAGPNIIRGGDGDDTVNGRAGNDDLGGGDGTDLVTFSGAPGAITASLSSGTASGDGTDTLALFENMSGSGFADLLRGDGNANRINGYSGNDEVRGYKGHDDLLGGTGGDDLIGDAGNDSLAGGPNSDDCSGGSGTDSSSSCEVKSGIP